MTESWAWLFAVAGRARARPVRQWHSVGGQRVLVVAPHPDDEVCGCGGTILLHRRAGDEVWVAHVTDGRRSWAQGLGPEIMSRRRRQEASAAAEILGVAHEWLGLREGEWETGALQERLFTLLRRIRPQVIYAPSRIDFHPEHARVASVLSAAIDASSAHLSAVIRVYQIQVPLTPVLTNLIAPVALVRDSALAALGAYRTQQGSVIRSLRLKRYAASFYRVPAAAEEFWELTSSGYRALHEDIGVVWGGPVFRGVRSLPFLDPAAYLTGVGARRALRRRVEGAA